MAWSPPRRKGTKLSRIWSTSLGPWGCVLLTFGLLALVTLLLASPLSSERSLSRSLRFLRAWKPIRKVTPGQSFGTITQMELSTSYNMLSDAPQPDKLIATLQTMYQAGVDTVVFSMSWEWGEPQPDAIRYDYINQLMDSACLNTGLKVHLMVDLVTPPQWIWDQFFDAGSRDADRRSYKRLSWFHPLSNDAGRRFLGNVAGHLARAYPTCVRAIQPVYNNVYEAKYAQEYDSFQDYGEYALAEYRNWLKARGTLLSQLNARWGSSFADWEQVIPPVLHSGDVFGVDFGASYWDFLKFREEYGASVYVNACVIVQEAGLRCFHRIPEFFTVMDAIYGASMLKRIAASPHVDFLVTDSSLISPYGGVINPRKLRVFVAAAASYAKPVFFEAAADLTADLELLGASFASARLAGAEHVGISSWHGRLQMDAGLSKVMRSMPACKPDELVGLFIHLDSCAAFHGLQYGWERKEPLHDFIEALAERLSQRCQTDVAVYVELDRFLAQVGTFSRVVFVEPLVLYDSKELASYVAAKAALQRVPHQVLRLPANITTGPQLMVLQDLITKPGEVLGVSALGP